MTFISPALQMARFARDAGAWLRVPLTMAEARENVRRNVATRSARFLAMLDGSVFANPRSPYLKLLQQAGCTRGDIVDLVRQSGLEGALLKLSDAGVYVTYDDFKGRVPIVRGSTTIHVAPSDYDNLTVAGTLQSHTGGTRGKPMPVGLSIGFLDQTAPQWAVWFDTWGWSGRDLLIWSSAHAGIAARQLRCAKFGKPFVRWFSTGTGGRTRDRLAAFAVHELIRRAAHFPRAEDVPLDQPEQVLEPLEEARRRGKKICLITTPSSAVRLGAAATARGLTLEHVAFLLGSEPTTPARRAAIETSGARAVATYGFTEGGGIGAQCPHAQVSDEVHVFADAFAVIGQRVEAGNGSAVNVFELTSLLPAAPKILLNTRIGDYGVLLTKPCGCALDELGYRQRLHTIRSFEKLTGEGITILGGDIARVIEEILPATFGGRVVDYQFVETTDARGLARYTLRIDPSVRIADGEDLLRVFVSALCETNPAYLLMTAHWKQADNLRVVRAAPLATGRGKVLPVRVLTDAQT